MGWSQAQPQPFLVRSTMADWKYNNSPPEKTDRAMRQIIQEVELGGAAQQRKRKELEKLVYSSATVMHAAQTCDGCGEETSKRLKKCSRCESAYYCSAACQKADWKTGGHKLMCATLKTECERSGKAVVDQLNNESLDPLSRVHGLERLDRQGPYTVAVRCGLHDAVRKLFEQEARLVQARFEAGIYCSWVHMVVCMLFRGQRREIAAGAFKKLDSSRVAGFIQSHVKAWDAWLDSAIALSDMLIKIRTVSRTHDGFRAARDVWNTMHMVLTKPGPAQSIFFNEETKDNPAKLKARATTMAKKIKSAMDNIAGASEAQDPNSIVEANMNQAAAMLSCWCTKLNVGVDFEALLNLRGCRRSLYKAMAVPIAEATIRKGAKLSTLEYKIALGQS